LREPGDKLINSRIKWYMHFSRINENRIPKISNLKIKEKCI
jgi:hypothetical protein